MQDWPTLWLLAAFAIASATVLGVGLRMTGVADRIADSTGFGEALIGGVLLGAATSLAGTVVSVTSALDGQASMAFSNGVGGIAAQTFFLALADTLFRKANLEHASAEVTNLFQAAMLMCLLSIPLVAYALPEVTIWQINPASVVLVGAYIAGVLATNRAKEAPMWRPVRTRDTREDEPEEEQNDANAKALIIRFVIMMLIMGVAGWTISQTGIGMMNRFGLSGTIVGALMTAVVTSLPELVTTLAAVRRGAMQLAMGGIIGGNTFDTLFLSLSDAAYRDGSLYHAVGRGDLFWLTVGMLMTGILLMGLILRERQGPFRIGFESALLFVIYGGAVAVQVATG